jgi:hypothetical protein
MLTVLEILDFLLVLLEEEMVVVVPEYGQYTCLLT